MDLMDKLTILADAAKYDAACTSSGLDRAGRAGRLGSTMAAGCCHSFSADGRCISLLKILYDEHLRLRLPVLCQPPVQRSAPGCFYSPGAGRTHHPVLPPQLY